MARLELFTPIVNGLCTEQAVLNASTVLPMAELFSARIRDASGAVLAADLNADY